MTVLLIVLSIWPGLGLAIGAVWVLSCYLAHSRRRRRQ
jgi:hypothetical protein